MQAITTKYIGPRNVKGSRCKAHCQAGAVTLEWNDAQNSRDNHVAAARFLASKMGWHGHWIGGWNHDGHMVFVCNDPMERETLHFTVADPALRAVS